MLKGRYVFRKELRESQIVLPDVMAMTICAAHAITAAQKVILALAFFPGMFAIMIPTSGINKNRAGNYITS
jgi:hypothetical protein